MYTIDQIFIGLRGNWTLKWDFAGLLQTFCDSTRIFISDPQDKRDRWFLSIKPNPFLSEQNGKTLLLSEVKLFLHFYKCLNKTNYILRLLGFTVIRLRYTVFVAPRSRLLLNRPLTLAYTPSLLCLYLLGVVCEGWEAPTQPAHTSRHFTCK